jgi:hypothetical protein
MRADPATEDKRSLESDLTKLAFNPFESFQYFKSFQFSPLNGLNYLNGHFPRSNRATSLAK